MLFVRHVNMTIGGVHGSLKLFFLYMKQKHSSVWFLQVERTVDITFLCQTYWTLVWKSLSF